jgi:hypothetical protein
MGPVVVETAQDALLALVAYALLAAALQAVARQETQP